MLSRAQIQEALSRWNVAWNNHDLHGVMELFHEDILFDNWTGGRVQGKEALREAWEPWFRSHGGFRFHEEDTLIDEAQQKVLFQWTLDWPSNEQGFHGKLERRRGVDVMHFRDDKIVIKNTYSKTTLEIGGKRVKLVAG